MTFEKGRSGNPAGRPPGIRTAVAQMLDNLVAEDAERIYRAMVALAVDQLDPAAAKMLLDRAWPVPKARRIELADLPAVRGVNDVRDALAEVLRATAAGEITPDEGKTLAEIIDANRRGIETGELLGRIERLENDRARGGYR